MMVGKEDLGLSLSLGPDSNHNINRPNFLNSFFQQNPQQQRGDLAASVDERRRTTKGIDVNLVPEEEERQEHGDSEEEEEVGPCSPNSTVSSTIMSGGGGGGKRNHQTRKTNNNINNNNTAEEDHNDIMERAYCSSRGGGVSDEDDGDGSRKKLRLSKDQSAVLEESFKEHNTLNPKQKLSLANKLNLRARQVEVWFQNRRARTKLKQTEVDCDFLKRCCENLTEENRRLQKEVQELRALKLSPQLYMQMTPPTTLTMCPSCERITSSASSAATGSPHAGHRQYRPMVPTGAPWPPVPLRASFPPMQRS